MKNREILFRGKNLYKDEWVYGVPVKTNSLSGVSLITELYHVDGAEYNAIECDIIPETVGQFTGLTDKNGNKIFEGETCKILYSDWGSKLDSDPRTLDQYLDDISHEGEIVWDDESNGWGIRIYSKKYDEYSIWGINYGKHGHIKITSNIHDNPTA